MSSFDRSTMNARFPVARSLVDRKVWDELLDWVEKTESPDGFPAAIERRAAALGLPLFLADLARLEGATHEARSAGIPHCPPQHNPCVNPSLNLIRCAWQGLADLLRPGSGLSTEHILAGEEYVLILRHPTRDEVIVRKALPEDLLALKIVVEGIDPKRAAAEGGVSVQAIDAALDRAARDGLLIAPLSELRRERLPASKEASLDENLAAATVFTLQWHLTQACDLHCRHCYDRSAKGLLELSKALAVLDDLDAFCRGRHVRGQVSFTGGNPFLHPHFEEVYAAAAERGFTLAILGNPVPRERLERLIELKHPVFYQVSLEGLRNHNDWVRGEGHFDRTLKFLDVLRDLGIYSMVMLTLTRDNLNDVLPLAEVLRDRVDLFTFNRLAQVGEGAKLQLPSREDYAAFIESFLDAAAENPVIALKDNLINIVLHKKGRELFDGCTGYGCGAAFNFATVLPDGEVHACRKFPSPIGHLLQSTLAEIYETDAARAYRAGCRACNGCIIRPVCGGCLAVSYGSGNNPLEVKDPLCFMLIFDSTSKLSL